MYDLVNLYEGEKKLLSIFSLLPPEKIPFSQLNELFKGDDSLDFNLINLSKKGWIEYLLIQRC